MPLKIAKCPCICKHSPHLLLKGRPIVYCIVSTLNDFMADATYRPNQLTAVLMWWTDDSGRRQGGFKEVRSNPPFGLQKRFHIHAPLNWTFSALPFEIGPLVSLLLRMSKRVCLQLCEFVHEGPACTEHSHKLFAPLRLKERVNTGVKKKNRYFRRLRVHQFSF